MRHVLYNFGRQMLMRYLALGAVVYIYRGKGEILDYGISGKPSKTKKVAFIIKPKIKWPTT